MITIVEFKMSVAVAHILGIMVGKLSYQKEPCSIVLLVVEKSPEIDFHGTVLPLTLAVNLRVKAGGKPLLDFWEVTK